MSTILQLSKVSLFLLQVLDAVKDNKTMIVPCHIQLDIRIDEELGKILGAITMASDRVLPNSYKNILLLKRVGPLKKG